MAMWLSRMSTNIGGMNNDNDKHKKHQKFKPCSGISQCYSFYCSNPHQEHRNPYTRRSYDISTIQTSLVTEGIYRRDIISCLIGSGVSHIATKILNYLDSSALLAGSLVSTEWQQLLLSNMYTTPRFRKRIQEAIFNGTPTISRLTFSLEMSRAAVVDVTVDDDLNIFTLALLGGRPHVMSCSLLTHGKRKWVHRFTEPYLSGLTCIAAGLPQSLVALGDKDGQIHVYEASSDFKCLKLRTILAHHCGAIHSIIFHLVTSSSIVSNIMGHILSCSDDMTVGVVCVLRDGSLLLSKLLHGHVGRVRSIHVQGERVISGSDDRSVKLWNLEALIPDSNTPEPGKPLVTLTGHSGPVTGVLLPAAPYQQWAFSAAGCSVRLWDVIQGTCLKILSHGGADDCPVTTMSWISTFCGLVTVDADGRLRTFRLTESDIINREIITATSQVDIIKHHTNNNNNEIVVRNKTTSTAINENYGIEMNYKNNSMPYHSNTNIMTMQKYSPKQSLKFYGSRDPRLVTAWPENTILKIESIPHHFTAFSLRNLPHPSVTVHYLDYVTVTA